MKNEEIRKELEKLEEKLDLLYNKLCKNLEQRISTEACSKEIQIVKAQQKKLFESITADFTDGEIDIYLNFEKGKVSATITKHQQKKEIGQVEIRFFQSEYYGNIGYHIEKKEQGHNYTLKALNLLKDFIRSQGLTKLIITAYPENIPSNIVIKRFGGVLIKSPKTHPQSYNTYEVNLEEKEEIHFHR